MKVLKFGGTSVGSSTNINKVINILNNYSETNNVVGVVSAVGGITNKLLEAGQLAKNCDNSYNEVYEFIYNKHMTIISELIPSDNSYVKEEISSILESLKRLLDGIFLLNELSSASIAKLSSYGELMSSFIIAETMKNRDLNAELKNSQQLIVTDNNYLKADVNFQTTENNLKNYFDNSKAKITILPGFICKSEDGEITTLGRGGSDYTAAIVASGLKVSDLEIWTDVSGMYSANPRVVKNAHPIPSISYQEAMELSHFGAKVLYPPTIQPALKLNIPIHIKNTMKPEDKGTVISSTPEVSKNPIKGITHIDNVSLLTLEGNGMVGIPGFAKRLFEVLAKDKINVILITQASSEHSICFAVNTNDANKANEIIDEHFEFEIKSGKIKPISVEQNQAVVAVVGDQMKSYSGISGKLFSTLGKNNINIRAIAQGASEKNISFVISENSANKALNVLHEAFFEGEHKQLNVFITGVGNVGSKLLDQIKQQTEYLKENLKINIKVVGIANSRKMLFDELGINLNNWKEELNKASDATIESFFENVKELNLRNSIFVDVTANYDVAHIYKNYLSESISVVACNKIAASGDYKDYAELKELAKKHNAQFLFETNVGAGLPVIDTLKNLVSSGDKVNSIHAILSGSLNFIFNNYDAQNSFKSVVEQAQDEGYTEPDPRIDLSGTDVARKILILARESGSKIELSDIENNSFLSDEHLNAESVDKFYDLIGNSEEFFKNIFTSASNKECKLKYVAEFNNGKAKVGLNEIPSEHPFYNIEGKDNIVMLYTERYKDQPLIVKGAGAGADVTASGLFADIIRIANK